VIVSPSAIPTTRPSRTSAQTAGPRSTRSDRSREGIQGLEVSSLDSDRHITITMMSRYLTAVLLPLTTSIGTRLIAHAIHNLGHSSRQPRLLP
jgi:hypothetical protein